MGQERAEGRWDPGWQQEGFSSRQAQVEELPGSSRCLWPEPPGFGWAIRSAEAGGYWQSMNASNRCASCSGADVSSMRCAGAMCVVSGGAGGVGGGAAGCDYSAAVMHIPLPSLTLAAPLPAGPAPGCECLTWGGQRRNWELAVPCPGDGPARGASPTVWW